jgi:hypothetical protein
VGGHRFVHLRPVQLRERKTRRVRRPEVLREGQGNRTVEIRRQAQLRQCEVRRGLTDERGDAHGGRSRSIDINVVRSQGGIEQVQGLAIVLEVLGPPLNLVHPAPITTADVDAVVDLGPTRDGGRARNVTLRIVHQADEVSRRALCTAWRTQGRHIAIAEVGRKVVAEVLGACRQLEARIGRSARGAVGARGEQHDGQSNHWISVQGSSCSRQPGTSVYAAWPRLDRMRLAAHDSTRAAHHGPNWK